MYMLCIYILTCDDLLLKQCFPVKYISIYITFEIYLYITKGNMCEIAAMILLKCY